MFEFTNRNDDILEYFLMREAQIPKYVKMPRDVSEFFTDFKNNVTDYDYYKIVINSQSDPFKSVGILYKFILL